MQMLLVCVVIGIDLRNNILFLDNLYTKLFCVFISIANNNSDNITNNNPNNLAPNNLAPNKPGPQQHGQQQHGQQQHGLQQQPGQEGKKLEVGPHCHLIG